MDAIPSSDTLIGFFAIFTTLSVIVIIWNKFSSKNKVPIVCTYSYRDSGTLEWKNKFPSSNGHQQSPVNIITCDANSVCSNCRNPIKFSCEYYVRPHNIKAYNDGHSVVIYVRYLCPAKQPYVFGGPLPCSYQFYNARFRWGPNDDEGSEHYVNCHRFAMEMQVTHLKTERRYQTLMEAIQDGGLLIISYFFEAVDADNPFLESLVNNLNQIVEPFTSVNVESVPLACIIPPFNKQYFAYCGSLTHPPCTEGVRWIIQPEPLCISSRQVNQFRKLVGIDGPICTNTRPIQNMNSREVLYFE